MAPLRPPPLSLLDKYRGREPQTLYSTTVTVTGGAAAHGRASGIARSDDGRLNMELRLPPELGGTGDGPNPEQLFAASYAACFHGALSLLAARATVPIDGASVSASIDFCRDPMDGLFMLNANIRVRLPGVERAVAAELVRHAERFCPYTKMANDGINHVVALAPADDSREA
ncbi:peroxiredoxin [Burkholderia ubonensis]|uniref:Peroxiredoxin n=2 Tax=Burkholderia cepacia complex TaxID=87882 RepID=A0A1B4PLU9_BURCE|nr:MULTISPECIES: Ohr family peroxiredoxin [Burkholderia cepacia complex]AOK14874.1 peroxiredoxin [Burkholderia cepacia]AOK21593.1 peroxiredoxin [Burkholderia ubonensis]KVH80347.1 peroxiredoxin [Burkholderia ubonensis]KVO03135.1 peroxiredoxin [Burkholderia ubonensis]KVO29222.1 peroxiredoxin [Burkholderia ubonensis]